jgi:hypothetical protein
MPVQRGKPQSNRLRLPMPNSNPLNRHSPDARPDSAMVGPLSSSSNKISAQPAPMMVGASDRLPRDAGARGTPFQFSPNIDIGSSNDRGPGSSPAISLARKQTLNRIYRCRRRQNKRSLPYNHPEAGECRLHQNHAGLTCGGHQRANFDPNSAYQPAG